MSEGGVFVEHLSSEIAYSHPLNTSWMVYGLGRMTFEGGRRMGSGPRDG
jgi:hypothetical protein